jgi:hypothetical protein
MQRVVNLIGLILLIAVSAGAQGPTGVGSNPPSFSSPDFPAWQISAGYQYNRINLTGTPFNTNGLNTSVVRYFGKWFGVEGQLGVGFGNTGATSAPANLNVHSVFVGGGPKLAYRRWKGLEPWVHLVIGMENFRFSQTGGLLGNNTSVAGLGGGGIDYYLYPHVAVRAEMDAIESRFFSTNQRHFQVVSGLVFNF